MKARDHTFDFLCGLCIVRMICNHAIAMCGLRNYAIAGITWYDLMGWTFFFMCFFFFKAGYFNKSVSGNIFQYCKDRTKRLFVPYVTWSIIGAFVYFGALLLLPQINSDGKMGGFRLSHLWETSHSYGNSPCWFLMSFFVTYIIVHFIQKVKYLNLIVTAFPLISYWLYTKDSPLWLSLDNVFMGVFFFYLGHLWKVATKELSRPLVIGTSIILIMIFIIGNIYNHGEYTMSTNTWDGSIVGIIVNTVCILCGLSGLLHGLPQRRIPVINYIGEHSMVYFVAHYPLLLIFIYANNIAMVHYKHDWTICIILLIFLFFTCTLLVPFVERVPWMSGRWEKQESTNSKPLI